MISTGNVKIDAVIAELEANVLGMLEANVLKAGELAELRQQVKVLEEKFASVTKPADKPDAPLDSAPPSQT